VELLLAVLVEALVEMETTSQAAVVEQAVQV
jgi:hypothetical protein